MVNIMKHLILAYIAIVILSVSALAQERRVEATAGYSHLSTSQQDVGLPLGSIALRPTSQNGYQAGVTVNLNSTLGVTFEHSGHFGHQEAVLSPFGMIPTSLVSAVRTFHYQVGPKVTLFDGASKHVYFIALLGDVNRNGDDAFAFSVGAGIDHKLNDSVSLEILQGTYGFNRLARAAGAQLQKECRISTGIRFGR